METISFPKFPWFDCSTLVPILIGVGHILGATVVILPIDLFIDLCLFSVSFGRSQHRLIYLFCRYVHLLVCCPVLVQIRQINLSRLSPECECYWPVFNMYLAFQPANLTAIFCPKLVLVARKEKKTPPTKQFGDIEMLYLNTLLIFECGFDSFSLFAKSLIEDLRFVFILLVLGPEAFEQG